MGTLRQLSPGGAPRVVGHGAAAALLPDGRLHLRQGPIDLVIGVAAEPAAIRAAHDACVAAFDGLLAELVAELPLLRSGVPERWTRVRGRVASSMVMAVRPLAAERFLTPMAAVAGAVADRIATAVAAVRGVRRAHVNNGGDIALVLAPGEAMALGVVPSLVRAVPEARFVIARDDPVRGVATSGWDGHSLSLGIADAVTVLAPTAAAADAAATLIANAVTVDHPEVDRQPARAIDPDSDLGDRLVTVGVGSLPADAVDEAMENGCDYARHLARQGLIRAALLSLGGAWRTVGV